MSRKHLEAPYSLTPTQLGMLLETEFAPESGIHIEQLTWTLTGELDRVHFERAWQRVSEHHPALRTGFLWREYKEPRQATLEEVTIPVETENWRGWDVQDRKKRLAEYLERDRQRVFDTAEPPLMRLILIKRDRDKYRLIWTFHRILFDGPSLAIIIREVLEDYDAFREGVEPVERAVRPHDDYVIWLKQQNLSQAESYWRQALKGFQGPTLPGRAEQIEPTQTAAPEATATAAGAAGREEVRLPASLKNALVALAEQFSVSLPVLLQGLWTLLLGRYSGEQDIVFGVTFSERPDSLAGSEAIVGNFAHTLPLRVNTNHGSLQNLLNDINEANRSMRKFAHGAAHAREWSDSHGNGPLFETVFTFEELPLDQEDFRKVGLEIDTANARFTGAMTKYVISLLACAGQELIVTLVHDRARLPRETVRLILKHFAVLAREVVTEPYRHISEIMEHVPRKEFPSIKGHVYRDRMETSAEPKNDTERRLAEIWQELLRLERVGIHDNFFQLGAPSLLAVRLADEIRKRFDRYVDPAALVRLGTIAQLAESFEKNIDLHHPHALVDIQPHGTRRPFFCVHPDGASPLCYKALADQLGKDQPFYGLQPPGLLGDDDWVLGIEDLAARYVEAIKTVQPSGPYQLGGWSVGGTIAFEMARLLEIQGEQTSFLALIDAYVEDLGGVNPWSVMKTLADTLRNVAELEVPTSFRDLAQMARFVGIAPPESLGESIKSLTETGPADLLDWSRDAVKFGARFFPISVINTLSPIMYRPRPYGGSADLFRVQPFLWERGQIESLKKYCLGGVTVHEVPGNHMSLMTNQDHLTVLAEQLWRLLH